MTRSRGALAAVIAAWAACVHAPVAPPKETHPPVSLTREATDASGQPLDPRTESFWAWKQFCERAGDAGFVEAVRNERHFTCARGEARTQWVDAGPMPTDEEIRRFVEAFAKCLGGNSGPAFAWELLEERFVCPSGASEPLCTDRDGGACADGRLFGKYREVGDW